MSEPTKAPGLKRLRKNPTAARVKCANCRCERYGKCGCTKKSKQESK
jgi:hypothetical protein